MCAWNSSFPKITAISPVFSNGYSRGATSSQASAEKALQAVLSEMPHVLPFEAPCWRLLLVLKALRT